jgi:predicted dehydrogenase
VTSRGAGRLRAAVIGAGRIADEHLGFLARSDAAELVAVCDRSPALARFAAVRFTAVSSYVDAARMLDEVRPDVVHVLTPAATHEDLVVAALDAGAHVIVEKPIALRHAGLLRLLDAAQSVRRVVVEDHNYRFNRSVRTLEQLATSGTLGRVVEVEVRVAAPQRSGDSRYADPGLPSPSHHLPAGFAHEFLTHLAYLALRFVPWVRDVTPVWSKRELELASPVDELFARGRTPDGSATLAFSASTGPARISVTVRGTDGWAEAEVATPTVRHYAAVPPGGQLGPFLSQVCDGWRLAAGGVRALGDRLVGGGGFEGIQVFLTQTYRALREGGEPPVTAKDIRDTSTLVEAMLPDRSR